MPRTKGSTSNVQVRLADLNRLLQPDAIILIARRQADQLGLHGKAVYTNSETINAASNPPAIEEKVQIREVVDNGPEITEIEHPEQ